MPSARGPPPRILIGENRQQGVIGYGQQTDDQAEEERRPQIVRRAQENDPLPHGIEQNFIAPFQVGTLRPDHQETGHHCQEARPIDQEAAAFAEGGDSHTTEGRTDEPGTGQHGGIESDRIGQIVEADDLAHECLAGRNVHGIDRAMQQSDGDHLPDLHQTAQGQHRQDDSQRDGQPVGNEQCDAAIIPVRHSTGQRPQQEERDLLGKSGHTQQFRRPGHAKDQPSLGNTLDPIADVGDQLRKEIELIVPMPKGPT